MWINEEVMGGNMNPIRKQFFTPRVLLSISAGIAGAIMFSLFIPYYVLATILGLLLATSLAGLEKPRECVLLGSTTGSLVGLYVGARYYLAEGELSSLRDFAGLGITMLAGSILSGLLCAAYGWITIKVLKLEKQGRGPFF
jgi:hypothetical protein